MKTLRTYVGALSIVVVCLALGAGTVSAGIERSNFSSPGSGYIGSPNPSGCGGLDLSRYPGSTEYCTRWIPGHWAQVRVMVPGRWIYRPVWIPPQPRTQYRWVKGFWQTTGYNVRPDVYVWGTQNGGFYGVPYNMYQASGGGYFTPQGVWIPNHYGIQR